MPKQLTDGEKEILAELSQESDWPSLDEQDAAAYEAWLDTLAAEGPEDYFQDSSFPEAPLDPNEAPW